jgi:glycosyltransferase involved in cell wall biosynthesis
MVSIIIPTYNYGSIIAQTLDNVLQQTYHDWEAIVVDDGSVDHTAGVVDSYVKKDARIHYILQKNAGVSAARNHGLRLAKGDYIQFLDADDLLSTNKLSLQVQHLEQNAQVHISYTDHIYFETDKPDIHYPDYEMNNHHWLRKIDAKGVEALQVLIHSNIAVVSSPLIRRSFLQNKAGFPEHSRYTEDWEFWFNCAAANAHFSFLDHPDAKTLIRIHPNNTSQHIQIMQIGELEFRKRIEKSIGELQILTSQEMEQLLTQNAKSVNTLFKYMMYHANLLNPSELQMYAKTMGLGKFVSYYFKGINYQRKELFKKWLPQPL